MRLKHHLLNPNMYRPILAWVLRSYCTQLLKHQVVFNLMHKVDLPSLWVLLFSSSSHVEISFRGTQSLKYSLRLSSNVIFNKRSSFKKAYAILVLTYSPGRLFRSRISIIGYINITLQVISYISFKARDAIAGLYY